MSDNTLLIPKRKAEPQMRDGMGADFWNTFWKDFNNPTQYTQRVNNLKQSVEGLTSLPVPNNQDIYIEVKLEDKAKSKTSKPSMVWQQAGLDIVQSRSKDTVTVSGKKSDFQKLTRIINESSFDKAKVGVDTTRTNKNMYRELFAMSGAQDVNTNLEKRVDITIKKLIDESYQDYIDCFIELYSNQPKYKYDPIYNELTSVIPADRIEKRDTELLFHNLSYRAKLKVDEIEKILKDINFSYIRLIKIYPTFSVQRCIPDNTLTNTRILNPQTTEVVGIIDSGIDNPVINGLVSHRIKHLAGRDEDTNHGTFVASRVLFGHNIFYQIENGNQLVPCAKVFDIQVLHKDGNGDVTLKDIDLLKKAIMEVLNRHPEVRIFNLSIANRCGIDEDDIDELTEFFDLVSRKYDVIFICSSGNNNVYPHASNFDDLFKNPGYDTRVASPADGLNVISVGAIAQKISGTTITQLQNYPSPFTRKGGFRGGWKKPELVMEGGNVDKDRTGKYDQNSFMVASINKFGVEGITNNKLAKDIGTSFSAPLVTRQSIYLLNYINNLSNLKTLLDTKGNTANLVKALLVHSTARSNQIQLAQDYLKHTYGFGIPDYNNAIRDKENEASVVYCDTVSFDRRKHRINLDLPDYLVNQPVEFIFTLVYNPPVNKDFPSEYNMIRLSSSIKTLTPIPDLVTRSISFKENYLTSNKWGWDNYQQKNFNVIHFRAKKKKLKSKHIEILVQMYIGDKYVEENVGHEANINQPYALLLTIIDKSNQNKLKTEMIATNQFETLIETEAQIEETIPA